MLSTSEALVRVADEILGRIGDLSLSEILKRGRKYKYVNNYFQRIREEDKHLIVYPEHPEQNVALILAYLILQSMTPGIEQTHKDLCLMIMGIARMLEQNRWCEEENSLVIHYSKSKLVFDNAVKNTVVDLAAEITDHHLEMGYNIIYCSKINFLHTDHHIGTKLENQHMRGLVEKYFGPDAPDLPEVLTALKCSVHWAHIKGVLYKLEVRGLTMEPELKERFDLFPDPSPELLGDVHSRFPSGTSRYSLLQKSLTLLSQYKYARLIPYPSDSIFDCKWLFQLCAQIEREPVRYHLRAKVKNLAASPVNLNELSQQYNKSIDALFTLISYIINSFPETGGWFLHQNSRIPELTEDLIRKFPEYYDQVQLVGKQVTAYENEGWATSDIVLRLMDSGTNNIQDEVSRQKAALIEGKQDEAANDGALVEA